jgi:hypothetical protein
MTRVLRIDADGVASMHKPDPGDLRAWQDLVGGFIEPIFGPGWCGYVNEDGRNDGLAFNPVASMLVRDMGGLGYGLLVGPVLFFGPADEQGDPTDLPEFLLAEAAVLLAASGAVKTDEQMR